MNARTLSRRVQQKAAHRIETPYAVGCLMYFTRLDNAEENFDLCLHLMVFLATPGLINEALTVYQSLHDPLVRPRPDAVWIRDSSQVNRLPLQTESGGL